MTVQADPNLLVLFTLLPLFGAGLSLVIGCKHIGHRLHSQSLIALAVGIGNAFGAGYVLYFCYQVQPLVLHLGTRTGPFGITLIADTFAALMLTVTAVVYVASIPYAIDLLDGRDHMGYFPLSLFLLMGVNGTFLAGDIFNLFVFFEILVTSSFVLLTLGGQGNQIRGGMRFFVLNLLASFIFLGGIALVYGVFGTLNFAHLASLVDSALVPSWVLPVMGGLFFVAFGNKAALFPLHFWLPSSYHTTHPAVNALFAGLLTKVGIYALMRVFPLLLPELIYEWHLFFLVIAGITITVGTVGAFSHRTIRRMLNFKIIGHVGFIFLGLGMAGSSNIPMAAGLAAAIVYLVHHMLVKTALLMAGGIVEQECRTGRVFLNESWHGGLLTHRPWLGIWFFLSAISLLGMPPFSGFVGKVGIVQLLVADQQWILLTIVTVSGILTLMLVIRIWQSFFWGKTTQKDDIGSGTNRLPAKLLAQSPVAGLVICSLLLGVFGQQIYSLSAQAAEELQDRSTYIAVVGLTTDPLEGHH